MRSRLMSQRAATAVRKKNVGASLASKMKILKLIACVAAAAVILLFFGWATNMVGFHYPLVFEDEPLNAPVRVMRIEGEKLFLADDRVIAVEHSGDQLNDNLVQSDFVIDLEHEANGDVIIFARRQDGWVCGTPWAQPIRIPIFPDTVYRNRRELIAWGRIESTTHGTR